MRGLRSTDPSKTCKHLSTGKGKHLGISKHVRVPFIDGIRRWNSVERDWIWGFKSTVVTEPSNYSSNG